LISLDDAAPQDPVQAGITIPTDIHSEWTVEYTCKRTPGSMASCASVSG